MSAGLDRLDPRMDHVRRVHIGGEVLQLRSDAPPETIEQVAEVVDYHVRRIQTAGVETDRFRQGVLAALHVAGELHEAKAERDAALQAREGALARLAEALTAREKAESERDAAIEGGQLGEERDEAVAERDQAESERDEALEARARAEVERDEALAAKAQLVVERDEALAARALVAAERDAALHERESLVAERDAALAARVELELELAAALADCDAARDALGESVVAREQAEAERDAAVALAGAVPPAASAPQTESVEAERDDGVIEMRFDQEPTTIRPRAGAPAVVRSEELDAVVAERDAARERCAELYEELDSMRARVQAILERLEGL